MAADLHRSPVPDRPLPRPEPQLQPDGSVFPPVTPDPPAPPGYVSPVEESPTLDDPWRDGDDGV
jgi:hypothetical protein